MKVKVIELPLPDGEISMHIDIYGRATCYLRAGEKEHCVGSALIENIASKFRAAGEDSKDATCLTFIEGDGSLVFRPAEGGLVVSIRNRNLRPLLTEHIDNERLGRWRSVLEAEVPKSKAT